MPERGPRIDDAHALAIAFSAREMPASNCSSTASPSIRHLLLCLAFHRRHRSFRISLTLRVFLVLDRRQSSLGPGGTGYGLWRRLVSPVPVAPIHWLEHQSGGCTTSDAKSREIHEESRIIFGRYYLAQAVRPLIRTSSPRRLISRLRRPMAAARPFNDGPSSAAP